MIDKEMQKNRMDELKVRVKRKVINKDIENVMPNVNVDDFISITETILLSKKVYEKINEINYVQEISKDILSNVNKLKSIEGEFDLYKENIVILFHYEDRECGAFRIKLASFFDNTEKWLDVIKFTQGYRDLILVDETLQYGICIERDEYKNKFIIWK